MRVGLLYVEDNDDALSLDIKSHLTKIALPNIYDITFSDQVFLDYVSNRKYEVVLAVIKTYRKMALCTSLIAKNQVKADKIYFVRVAASRAIITGWSGEVKIHSESIAIQHFKSQYTQIFKTLLDNKESSIMLKIVGADYQKVFLNDIIFLRSSSQYTTVFTTLGQSLKTRLSQINFMTLFPDRFISVHKLYIVNRVHIISEEEKEIILRNGYAIPKNAELVNIKTIGD